MSILCTIGLAVCLNYKGETLTLDETHAIGDGCIFVEDAPINSFAINQEIINSGQPYARGYFEMDWLESAGLKFNWKPQNWNSKTQKLSVLSRYRYNEIRRACDEFNRISLDSRNWS